MYFLFLIHNIMRGFIFSLISDNWELWGHVRQFSSPELSQRLMSNRKVFFLCVPDRSGWQWPSILLASFGRVWDTYHAEMGLRAPPGGRLQQGRCQQQPAWCSADQWGREQPHPASPAPQGWATQEQIMWIWVLFQSFVYVWDNDVRRLEVK